MKYSFLIRLISASCILLGTAGLLVPQIQAYISPNSGLVVVFAALALLLSGRTSRWARSARLGLATAILLLAAITLAQRVLDVYPDLEPWPWGLVFSVASTEGMLQDRFANMAAIAALGFMLYGIAVILLAHLKTTAVWLIFHVLVALSFTLALCVEMAYLMDVSFLLAGEVSVSGQISWPTATHLLLLNTGLYLAAIGTDFARAYYLRHEDHQIITVTTFVLWITAVGAGLAGAGALLRQSYEISQQTLKQEQTSKAALFEGNLKAAHDLSERIASLLATLRLQRQEQLFHGLSDFFSGTKDTNRPCQLVAVEVVDGTGVRMVMGELKGAQTVRIPLKHPGNAWLVWRDGWMLESHVRLGGGHSGKVIAYVRLNQVEQLLDLSHDLGMTEVLVVCAPYDSATMQCLPSRLNPAVARVNRARHGNLLPTALAMQGKEGVAVVYDNYGHYAIAAYGPIGSTGLGMTQKIDTSELYAPLRKHLWLGIASVLLLTMAGAALLWRVVRPLTSRLLDTRAYLRGLTGAIPEGVITTNDRDEVETINPATTQLFDYTAADIQGKNIDVLFADEPMNDGPAGRVSENRSGKLHGTGRAAHQRLGRRKGGETFPVELTVTEFNQDGQQHFVAVVRDVTARREAEEALLRSEEMFRALVENAPDVIIRIDRAHRRVYANPAFEEVTGMSRQAAVGKTHDESWLAPVIDLDWNQAVDQVIETGKDKSIEFTLTRSAGLKYLQVRFVPEHARDGSVQSVLALGRDVTVARQAETVLRESENRLRRITTHLPGMVFQLLRRAPGVKLQFTYVSEGASELCGLSSGIVLADTPRFLELIFGEDRALFDRSMDYSAVNLAPWSWEGRIRAGNFGETWVSLRATPARTLDGSIVWDGIILNVHQSKLNELEIRQSRESLRMLTAHREAVREEERKHIAREIHDELGQALTALKMEVSMIGIGFGRDNPELGEKVRLLIKIINHTIQTVRHVATSLRPAALDLGIESAIEWLAREFCKRHRIEGIIDVPGEGELHLDESEATALVRIVQEALTNIARHSGATRVEISLKTRGQVLCLSVADDGRGFDPEEAKNGSSFGLKGITERVLMLDGTIDIESRPGNGTKLSVCIPVSSGAEPDGANLE